MNNQLHLTNMEAEILEILHELYAGSGFPCAENIQVISRRNTGAGRYVHLNSEVTVDLPNGPYDMGGRFISNDQAKDGMMAVVYIDNKKLKYLEISTYGNVSWDGNEDKWCFVG